MVLQVGVVHGMSVLMGWAGGWCNGLHLCCNLNGSYDIVEVFGWAVGVIRRLMLYMLCVRHLPMPSFRVVGGRGVSNLCSVLHALIQEVVSFLDEAVGIQLSHGSLDTFKSAYAAVGYCFRIVF